MISQFMQERYNEVCDQVLNYKDHREPLVRRAVIELIPTLASYNHQEFIAKYLHPCMIYLLGQLKKERDRTTCTLRVISAASSERRWKALTYVYVLNSLPSYRTRGFSDNQCHGAIS